MPVTRKPTYNTSGSARDQARSVNSISATRSSLLRLDPLYAQLNQLGLITSHFDEEYRFNRRQATSNLLRQLVFIQNLYQGSRFDVGKGDESLQIRAMDLNTHLISTAGFGAYSNAAKINILYQLRKVLENMLETHFCAVNRQPK